MLSAVSGLYKKTIFIFCSLTSLVEFLTYLMLTRLKKKNLALVYLTIVFFPTSQFCLP